MKKFFIDLFDCYKVSGKFMKDHWKGYFLMVAIIEVAWFGWFYKDEIKKYFIERNEKKDQQ